MQEFMHELAVGIATLCVYGQQFFKFVLLFMGVMVILWTFQVMKDPKKQFDLAMDLFKKIILWHWKAVLLAWSGILFILDIFMRIMSVTFATVRDFFMSKN